MTDKISVTKHLLHILDNRDSVKAELKQKFEALYLGDPQEAKRQMKIAKEAIRQLELIEAKYSKKNL